MKNRFFIVSVSVVVFLLSYELRAQERSNGTQGQNDNQSQLRLGFTGYARGLSNFGVEVGYEMFLSPRWSIEGSLFNNLRTDNNFKTIYGGRVGSNEVSFENYNHRLAFSIAANYYLKKGSRTGHHLSIYANHLFTVSDRTEYVVRLQNNIVSAYEKRSLGTNPVVGIYYGYRKTFESGFFIEGRAGTIYGGSIQNILRPFRDLHFDAQLTVGWTIPFTKKKKR